MDILTPLDLTLFSLSTTGYKGNRASMIHIQITMEVIFSRYVYATPGQDELKTTTFGKPFTIYVKTAAHKFYNVSSHGLLG